MDLRKKTALEICMPQCPCFQELHEWQRERQPWGEDTAWTTVNTFINLPAAEGPFRAVRSGSDSTRPIAVPLHHRPLTPRQQCFLERSALQDRISGGCSPKPRVISSQTLSLERMLPAARGMGTSVLRAIKGFCSTWAFCDILSLMRQSGTYLDSFQVQWRSTQSFIRLLMLPGPQLIFIGGKGGEIKQFYSCACFEMPQEWWEQCRKFPKIKSLASWVQMLRLLRRSPEGHCVSLHSLPPGRTASQATCL